MPQLFTVKWPHFALVEAALLFPIAVAVAGVITADAGLRSSFAPFGLVESGHLLIALTMTAVPFFGLLVAVDRLLIAPKGFLALGCLATVIWALLAAALSDRFIVNGFVAGLATGAAAFLVHLKILWIGLCDEGFAAMRLGVERRVEIGWQDLPRQFAHGPDVADARQAPGLIGRVRRWLRKLRDFILYRTSTSTVLIVLMVSGWVYASYRWVYLGHHNNPPAVSVEVAPVIPVVEVPSDGEATAVRDPAGHYVFDAEVNGVPMAMVYDDDVPLVTLRAEDAVRVGVSFNRLDFSSTIDSPKGPIAVAGITISSMTVGSITYRLVPGYVAREGSLDENLFGHSFLGRLSMNRRANDRMTLKGPR